MLPKWSTAFLVLLHEAWSTRPDAHIRFLKLQVEMLKARLPGNRVVLDQEETIGSHRLSPAARFYGKLYHFVISDQFVAVVDDYEVVTRTTHFYERDGKIHQFLHASAIRMDFPIPFARVQRPRSNV